MDTMDPIWIQIKESNLFTQYQDQLNEDDALMLLMDIAYYVKYKDLKPFNTGHGIIHLAE
jgi:hypothetical protein|tara:strand:- start:338 stop:517 length:180 start_codon:yes stop_codon:yes gene_type:complete